MEEAPAMALVAWRSLRFNCMGLYRTGWSGRFLEFAAIVF
jgi:hypothetical protein